MTRLSRRKVLRNTTPSHTTPNTGNNKKTICCPRPRRALGSEFRNSPRPLAGSDAHSKVRVGRDGLYLKPRFLQSKTATYRHPVSELHPEGRGLTRPWPDLAAACLFITSVPPRSASQSVGLLPCPPLSRRCRRALSARPGGTLAHQHALVVRRESRSRKSVKKRKGFRQFDGIARGKGEVSPVASD